ncbi:lipoate--protein ligase family protein [bacterium]|nr:lipoate--protein ligase family protein [bacterium]
MQPDNVVEYQQMRHICSSGNLEVIRWSEPSVDANLKIDAQFAQCAARSGNRTVRLWWGSGPTIVLGCGDKPELALNLDECRKRGIEWVRRITGGGTVLQTPGVFNYSYTAPSGGRMDMDRVFRQGADLIIKVLARFGVNAWQRGVSDVAVGELKVSGNAQARKWKSILLHGTLLVDIDRKLMEDVLKYPSKEPDYRDGRSHSDFIVTLKELGAFSDPVILEKAFASAAVEVFG